MRINRAGLIAVRKSGVAALLEELLSLLVCRGRAAA